jgi:hypothetical protein
MAFPQTANPTSTVISTAATSHDINMPSSVNSGALLIAIIEFKSTVSEPVITNPSASGWTNKSHLGHGGNNLRWVLAWKVADGDEGGTTVDWVSDVNSVCAAHVYHVTAWEGTLANGVDFGGNAVNVGNTPDPPTLNPGAWGTEDTLWIAVTGFGDDDKTTTGYPAGFTGGTSQSTGNGADASCSIASARDEEAIGSKNPGTFTIADSESEGWAATTIGIRPGSAGVSSGIQIFRRRREMVGIY